MNIDVPDSLAMEVAPLDEPQNFLGLCHHSSRKGPEQLKDRHAVAQASARDLANHERMHEHIRSFQQVDKSRIATTQVIDPHRRVDEDQAGPP